MASKVNLALTWGQDTATLILDDPLGPNNSWSCDPANFLSKSSGKWAQGAATFPVVLSDASDHEIVLQFDALNMFNPQVGQSGSAVSQGDGGTVGDTQVVKWVIDAVT